MLKKNTLILVLILAVCGCDMRVPACPGSLRVAEGDSKTVIIWDSVSTATAYNIYWGEVPGVTKDNGTRISNAESPYLHRGLENNTSYYYIITAENSFGEGKATTEAKGTPGDLPDPPSDCPSPLDNNTLSALTILWPFSHLEIMPGQSSSFQLCLIECCYDIKTVDACVVWSVTPGEGAAIDPITGLFRVDATTPSGTVYTVMADIEDGRRVLTRDIYVYTPEANPLVGTWREIKQLSCWSGREVVPEHPIEEIIFYASGDFTVTWYPFEVYVDYWGTYTYDLDSGSLDLEVINGNYIPGDIDGKGSFHFNDDGELLLENIWLGIPEGSVTAACGHVLSRN